ncbi:MAG: PaaX family transcriptional regulator C-terminal domain-containing protein [Roseovarius sp.]
MGSAQFEELVAGLSGDRPPRVWSLLVTIFGELAQEEDARISSALILHLSDIIGLKPEAVRVALHRLRKDGWIESRRRGRNSDYVLTGWGRAQSMAASPRIYATAPLAERASLAIFEPGSETETAPDGAWISPNLLLTSQAVDAGGALTFAVTEATALPGWMRARLCDEETVLRARRLLQALGHVAQRAEAMTRLNPCETAALRVLVVHDWRRIVLKLPALPDFVFPEEMPLTRCREETARLLQRLRKQDLGNLERAIGGDDMPRDRVETG